MAALEKFSSCFGFLETEVDLLYEIYQYCRRLYLKARKHQWFFHQKDLISVYGLFDY